MIEEEELNIDGLSKISNDAAVTVSAFSVVDMRLHQQHPFLVIFYNLFFLVSVFLSVKSFSSRKSRRLYPRHDRMNDVELRTLLTDALSVSLPSYTTVFIKVL